MKKRVEDSSQTPWTARNVRKKFFMLKENDTRQFESLETKVTGNSKHRILYSQFLMIHLKQNFNAVWYIYTTHRYKCMTVTQKAGC